jgi:hypothetical protein
LNSLFWSSAEVVVLQGQRRQIVKFNQMNLNKDFLCSFLDDIPERFLLQNGLSKSSTLPFDENEKKFIVTFISLFNVDAQKLCNSFSVSYSTFKHWKKFYHSLFSPMDLLEGRNLLFLLPFPLSRQEQFSGNQPYPRIPLNRYCLSRGNGRQEWELMLFFTLMLILSLIIRFLFPWLVKRGKHSFRTKNEVQIDHKKLSDLLKLKARPNQQQNNERIPSTNVNLEEKPTSTEKRTVKKESSMKRWKQGKRLVKK